MTDRERLIELLAEAIVEHTVCSRDGHPVSSYMCRIVAGDEVDILADNLIAHGVTVQRWVPVTERLPEKHGCVCVCLLKFPDAKEAFAHCLTWHAYGDNGYVKGPHFSDEGLDGLKVTHWMPLPEAPNEEA